MGFPGLNLPQQVPAPQGAVGGVVPPNPTAINRTPRSAQITQGISQLMQGFMAMKRGEEQHYGQKVDDISAQLAAGNITPDSVDFKQVAQWMKKSNRGYNTDQTPAQQQELQAMMTQQNYQQTLGQAQQGAQALASQSSGMPAQPPGPMGSPGQPGVAAPGVTPPPSAPQAVPPGLMDRIRMMLGKGPSESGQNWSNIAAPSAMSPAAQSIRALGQAAQTGGGMPGQIQRGLESGILAKNVQAAAGQLGIAHDTSMAPVYSQVFQKALGGDLDSMTMLRRLDVFKGVPIDEVGSLYKAENPLAGDAAANSSAAKLLLWQQGGGPALQLRIADLSKEMIPRFANSGDPAGDSMRYVQSLYSGTPYNGPRPGVTADEFDKQTTATTKMVERYPAAPVGLAKMYGDAVMTGQKDLAGNILDFLSSHYKTATDIQQGQFGATLGQSESQFRRGQSQSESQFQRRVSLDALQTASQNEVGNREADNGQLRFYNDAIETMLKATNYQDILKNGTQAQKDTLSQRVNDLVNSLAGQKITVKGREQQLAPYQALADRNNVQNPWYHALPGVASQGPLRQGSMLPSFAPAPGGTSQAPKSGRDLLTPQDYQMLGLPFPGSQSGQAVQPGIQQLLLQRALGK